MATCRKCGASPLRKDSSGQAACKHCGVSAGRKNLCRAGKPQEKREIAE